MSREVAKFLVVDGIPREIMHQDGKWGEAYGDTGMTVNQAHNMGVFVALIAMLQTHTGTSGRLPTPAHT